MNRLIIEPHPDDAFLSLGGHLESLWREEENTILTVWANPKREAEAQAYAFEVGAYHACLGKTESRMDSETPDYKDRGPVADLLAFIRTERWDQIIFPVGLQHPDHLRLSNFSNWYYTHPHPPVDLLWYLDTPYQIKQKNQEELREKLHTMAVYSIHYPGKRKWRLKKLFPSQGMFFHYNPFEKYCMPELVLSATQP